MLKSRNSNESEFIQEDSRIIKQDYLRTEIIEKGYNANSFKEYCDKLKKNGKI